MPPSSNTVVVGTTNHRGNSRGQTSGAPCVGSPQVRGACNSPRSSSQVSKSGTPHAIKFTSARTARGLSMCRVYSPMARRLADKVLRVRRVATASSASSDVAARAAVWFIHDTL